MKKIITLFLIGFLFINCQGQSSKSVTLIDKKTFAKKLEATENAQLLDVRSPGEYAENHIENSKNINWNGTDFIVNVEKLDKLKPVFVYCKVGGRSKQACEKLSQLGFIEIYDLQGGILKWNEKE